MRGGSRFVNWFSVVLKSAFAVVGMAVLIEKDYMIDTFIFIRILNQLRVFVTRSRHKCSIGLNR